MAETTPQKKHKSDGGGGGDDRLSGLPNELLLRILIAADLDIEATVNTSLLSTRWRSLWKSCLPSLHFQTPSYYDDKPFRRFLQNTLSGLFRTITTALFLDKWADRLDRIYAYSLAHRVPPFRTFVENVLSLRDFGSPLSLLTLTVPEILLSDKWADLFDRISAYGLAHRVPTFRLTAHTSTNWPVMMPPSLVSSAQFASLCASVRNLHLSVLWFNLDELMSHCSNFPALTSLRLRRCIIHREPRPIDAQEYAYAPFALIPNLEKLELTGCDFESVSSVQVTGDNLAEIAIVYSNNDLLQPLIQISAPRCRYLACSVVDPDYVLTVELPALDCLDFDGVVPEGHDRSFGFHSIISLLGQFGNAEFVKLRPNAIKTLTSTPELLDDNRFPPFKRLKCVELYGTISTVTKLNSLVRYLFGDCVQGSTTHLFHRTNFASQVSDNNSRPVIIRKSDLLCCTPGLK